ncbi:MAG TPA: glycosyltransferase family 4 protein [Bryobacteraceae bacterium]
MNILVLDQFSDPGGAQLCLMDLIPEMTRRGWRPRIMAPGNGEMLHWCRRAGVPTDPIPLRQYSSGRKTGADLMRFSIDVPRMVAAVRRIVRRERVDLIYVNGPRVLPSVMGLSVPVVFHAHSVPGGYWSRKLVAWMLRRTNATVIAASEYVAERLGSGHKIYNGVADLQNRLRQLDRRPIRVGILGRIAPEKGHLDFVQAAQQIVESGGDAKFFVYGERLFSDCDYDTRIRALARNAPVTFCGWTNDIAEALRNMDILAVPSGPGEAATRVIMEAFSAGTPVVAYRSGGIPELVEHGRTGILTETANGGSLASGIRMLMDDPELMKRLSAAGRNEWQQRFRVERFQNEVCDLLEKATKPARHFSPASHQFVSGTTPSTTTTGTHRG